MPPTRQLRQKVEKQRQRQKPEQKGKSRKKHNFPRARLRESIVILILIINRSVYYIISLPKREEQMKKFDWYLFLQWLAIFGSIEIVLIVILILLKNFPMKKFLCI